VVLDVRNRIRWTPARVRVDRRRGRPRCDGRDIGACPAASPAGSADRWDRSRLTSAGP